MSRELIIYCDESVKRGAYFSNFYGGALVEGKDLDYLENQLNHFKVALHFNGEVKFQKITENYCSKYIDLMALFFDFVEIGQIKIRIMFTQNYYAPTQLTKDDIENEYFKLYYQFIKHAFGLRSLNIGPTYLSLLFDEFPDKREKSKKFKEYLHNLENLDDFQNANIKVPKHQIREVRSHEHIILQCLDIILGAMQFRLNDMHKAKDPKTGQRGKRTKAKEKIYKYILERIRKMHPNFNLGQSTSTYNLGPSGLYLKPYAHWLFKSKEHARDPNQTKKQGPVAPTLPKSIPQVELRTSTQQSLKSE